jgi:hypothetical protein
VHTQKIIFARGSVIDVSCLSINQSLTQETIVASLAKYTARTPLYRILIGLIFMNRFSPRDVVISMKVKPANREAPLERAYRELEALRDRVREAELAVSKSGRLRAKLPSSRHR